MVLGTSLLLAAMPLLLELTPNRLLVDPMARTPGLIHLLALRAAPVAVALSPVILREPPLKLLQPHGHRAAVAGHPGD